jgi:hypothetical protein
MAGDAIAGLTVSAKRSLSPIERSHFADHSQPEFGSD